MWMGLLEEARGENRGVLHSSDGFVLAKSFLSMLAYWSPVKLKLWPSLKLFVSLCLVFEGG